MAESPAGAAAPRWRSAAGLGMAVVAAGRLRAGAARRPDRPDRAVQRQPRDEHPGHADGVLDRQLEGLPAAGPQRRSGTASSRRWSSRSSCRCSRWSAPIRWPTSWPSCAQRRRYTLLHVLLAPFFTSYLLRVIAWQVILNNNGVINSLLWELHLRRHGDAHLLAHLLALLGRPRAVLLVGAVRRPADLRRAREHGPAAARGGPGPGRQPAATFLRVTFPLSLPGVIAGFVFVLIPTTGEFITPLLVGGPSSYMFGNSIQAFFGDILELELRLGAGAVAGRGRGRAACCVFGRFLSTDLRETGRDDGRRPARAVAARAATSGC